MPWTDYQKGVFGGLIAGAALYVAGHTAAPGAGGANELAGHGYSRGAIAAARLSATSAGVISLSQDTEIYTPDDDNAEDITHLSYWDALVGGNMVAYSDVEIPDVLVPSNGQPVNLEAGTIINT